MKFRPIQVIISLLIALFFLGTTFFLLQEKPLATDYWPDPETTTVTAFKIDADLLGEKNIYTYPANPSPGDFLIVETSLLKAEKLVALKFDFPGVISEYYRAGNLFYAIIAIGFDTKPGVYQLRAEIGSNQPENETLTKEIAITEKDFSLSRFTMPPDRTAGWTAAQLAEDREKVRLAREMTEPHPLWLQTFMLPLEGDISSEFGAIRIINEGAPRRHNGLDIAAEEGTAIFAPNNGIVRLAEFLLSGGNTVIIDHGLRISSTYMHLHTIAVEADSEINRGELIGTVGMTGYSTGPHLHWEVNIGQTAVNPLQLMQNELLWIAPAYVSDLYSAGRQ